MPSKCSPPVREFVQRASKYDLVFLSGLEIMLAPSITTVTVFRVTGGDFTVSPFPFRALSLLKSHEGWKSLLNPATVGLTVFWSLLKRKSVRAADYVSFRRTAKPYQNAQSKLRIPETKILPGRRLVIDTDLYKPKKVGSLRFSEDEDFLIFLPSRAQLDASRLMRVTGQYKGSEKAIAGIGHFLSSLTEKERERVKVRIPSSKLSNHFPALQTLISATGFLENFQFLGNASESHLDRRQMIREYQNASVTLDDFGAGWYGSIVVEALACGSPVITWVSPSVLSEFEWHPIIVSETAGDIANHLRLLFYKSRHDSNLLSKRGREWIESFHSSTSGQVEMILLLDEIRERERGLAT